MIQYVALLRGINVGGNNRVEMSRLREVFTSLGFKHVTTYINSGNIIFEALENDTRKMTERIEKSLTEAFGFSLRVVLRDAENIRMLCEQIPATWENNEDQKTDVLFLWDEVNKIGSVGSIATNPDVDTLRYISGAIVWNIARSNYNKSGMNKFIGTKIYKNMTARNVNTLRKINELIHKP